MSQELRIALTVPSFAREFGGSTEVGLALQRVVAPLGYEVTVISAGSPSDLSTVDGHLIPLRTLLHFHGTPVPLALHRVIQCVRRADMVHIVGFRDPIGTVAAIAAQRLGRPYLLEPAGMHRRRLRSVRLKALFDKSLGRTVTGGATHIVATSSIEAKELTEDGVPSHKIKIRPVGIDRTLLAATTVPGYLRHRLRLAVDTPLVLSLGRISRKKGLVLVARAIAAMPDVHFVVVGPDDRDGTLEQLSALQRELELTDRLHVLTSGMWGADKAQAMADADVFCLVSETENFGITPVEAAACGTAVVVSDQCGAAEWLGDGAVVVPYGDAAAVTDVLKNLLADSSRRSKLARAGRLAAEKLTWDRVAEQQAGLYEKALSGR